MNFEHLQDVFSIFDNTEMDIIELGEYDDYEGTYADDKVIGTVMGDLQPYSSELAQKDYGLSVACQYAFYCPKNDNIKEGIHLTGGGKTYQVVHSLPWDMGLAVLLKEVDLSDRCEQDSQGTP